MQNMSMKMLQLAKSIARCCKLKSMRCKPEFTSSTARQVTQRASGQSYYVCQRGWVSMHAPGTGEAPRRRTCQYVEAVQMHDIRMLCSTRHVDEMHSDGQSLSNQTVSSHEPSLQPGPSAPGHSQDLRMHCSTGSESGILVMSTRSRNDTEQQTEKSAEKHLENTLEVSDGAADTCPYPMLSLLGYGGMLSGMHWRWGTWPMPLMHVWATRAKREKPTEHIHTDCMQLLRC